MQRTGDDAEYMGGCRVQVRIQSTREDAEYRGGMQMTEENAGDRIYTYGGY